MFKPPPKIPFDYVSESKQDRTRAHQLSSKVIDLTHDTLPEIQWKPIQKLYDRVPPVGVLEEKILL